MRIAILNPDHLFDQADKLVVPPPAGPSRQVDIRRAISSAYYGLFHYTLAAVDDEFVGVTQRTTAQYVLVYRSIDHRTLREICIETRRQHLSRKYAPYGPQKGFGANIQAFSAAAIELQEKRHSADYNPEPRLRTLDAKLAIETASDAVKLLARESPEDKRAFLTLLLCQPRSLTTRLRRFSYNQIISR